MYHGDYPVNATVRFFWNAFAVAGQSITRAVNGSIRVYKNNSATQRASSAGITDSEDFDGLTGLNHVNIDLSNNSDAGFYAAGNDYMVVIEGATIDGKVINAVIGHFSIENRSALMPTTAGRRLDVSAGGEAGMDWANVGSPASAVGLPNTTVGLVSSVGAFASSAIQSVWDRLTATLTAAGSVGKLLADNLNATVSSRASQADIDALNQSASRRVLLATVGQYEKPDTGSSLYTIELRTYDGDGAAVNAGSTPALSATGSVSGNLSANLSAAANPATGLYRWTYTVAEAAASEEIRLDAQAILGGSTFSISAYTLVTDAATTAWTGTDSAHLTAIFDKLPAQPYLTGTTDFGGGALLLDSTANQNVIAAGVGVFDPPTRTEAASDKNQIISEVGLNRAVINAVKSKTDQFTFAGGKVKATLDGETVGANLIQIEGAPTVDDISITEMFINIISALQGEVDRQGNTYSFKNRNGATVFSYTVSATGRVEA
jgi:hypothetical protein